MRTSSSFDGKVRHVGGGAMQFNLLSPGGIHVSPAAAAASAAAAAVAGRQALPTSSLSAPSNPTPIVARPTRSPYPATGNSDGRRQPPMVSVSGGVSARPSQLLSASIPKPLPTSPTYRSTPSGQASSSPKLGTRNIEGYQQWARNNECYQLPPRPAAAVPYIDGLDVTPSTPRQQRSNGGALAAALGLFSNTLSYEPAKTMSHCQTAQQTAVSRPVGTATPIRYRDDRQDDRHPVALERSENSRLLTKESVTSRSRSDGSAMTGSPNARQAVTASAPAPIPLAAKTTESHWEIPTADSLDLSRSRNQEEETPTRPPWQSVLHSKQAQRQHGQPDALGRSMTGMISTGAVTASARGRHAANMADIRNSEASGAPSTRCKTPPRTSSTRSCSNNNRRDDASRMQARVRSVDSGSRGPQRPAVRSATGGALERSASACRGTAAPPRQEREAPVLEEDVAEYSDRFLPGYERERLLGKGACAVVWLATPSGRSDKVAIKQIAKGTTGKKRSDMESARKEIFFGSYFFHTGGEPKLPPAQHPGMNSMAKLLGHQETKRDIWLIMEYGGTSLTKSAYEIRGEFLRGERLYRVTHLSFMQSLKSDSNTLRLVLRQLLSGLNVLSEHHVVHSDIKPDNILVDEDPQTRQPRCRFIDLGSAFSFDSPEGLALATPEYMPPEALENFGGRPTGGLGGRLSMGRGGASSGGRKHADSGARNLSKREQQPWSFDIWSLGSILLELALGTPLWMSYKCRVADDQRVGSAAMGLFAVPGRDPEKILSKQSEALRQRGLQAVLRGSAGVPLCSNGGIELLAEMLLWDPMERISPQEALEHPWMLG